MVWVLPLFSLVLTAREVGWIQFPLPERRLQTERVWAHSFGFVAAAAMWGFHIGLGFATRITYGGFWVVVVAILGLGHVKYGALLMATYWLGRALSVLAAPAILPAGGVELTRMVQELLEHRSLYRRMQYVGLVWSTVVGLMMALGLP